FVAENMYVLLASVASVLQRFSEAKEYSERVTELRSKYLGSKHITLIEPLQNIRYALHQLGEHEQELEIASRVLELDKYADNDEEFEQLDWCEPKVLVEAN
ncbi:MAG: tetratricopeptide repeat protein, partial [Cyanobacteria bacterium]|nr:tetratricopeptide repeat protein [Cyanobacteriota bacterium]